MALVDFYVSNENAYRTSCPIDLTNIDILESGWFPVVGKSNIFYMHNNYNPKIVSEDYSDTALYGRPYTRALDLQTLDSMVQGGFFYDVYQKNLYVKCFNLANANSVKILLSTSQAIESRTKSFYVHRNMALGNNSGVRFSATIGLGERFLNAANPNDLVNADKFYFSCLLVDPQPTTGVLVRFPSLTPITIDNVLFPGSETIYWLHYKLDLIDELTQIDVTSFTKDFARFAYVSRVYVSDVSQYHPLNATYRYDPDATYGDVKPKASNGSGSGIGNGWWVRVWGLEVEKQILETDDIGTLIALPSAYNNTLVYDKQLRKVKSNGLVYRYEATATTGNWKAAYYPGWWILVEPTQINDFGFQWSANHIAATLKFDSENKLTLSAPSIQRVAEQFSHQLVPITKASFKYTLELFPRTNAQPSTLDYVLKITNIVDMDGVTEPPFIATGTIENLPYTGNLSNYLVGFSLSEGVIIDDLVISEIIESVA